MRDADTPPDHSPDASTATEDAGDLVGTVLVVDDERNIRRTLRMVLEGEGARVLEAGDAEEGLAILDVEEVDVLIVDVKLPGRSGIEMLETIESPMPSEGKVVPRVILISGHATVSDAVRATRLGAFDFFEKPLSRDRVIVGVRNALERSRADRELNQLRSRMRGELISACPAMADVLTTVDKVAGTSVRVLITGESGTGKELIARAIHDASPRADKNFVKVNCAAIPHSLIESELFGHEKGAFTGASQRKKGLFELASGGSIFLDEIGDMGLEAQAKVLRVLQSGELVRVGGQSPVHIDVRVLSATHRNLPEMVARSEFREDLFFRLAVVPIVVPPLRDRADDILILVRHFMDEACRAFGMANKQIADDALARLRAWDWPGNVRELENVVQRMVVLSEGDLGMDDVPEELLAAGTPKATSDDVLLDALVAGGSSERTSLKEFRERAERALIRARLVEAGWNVSKTAESLGLERTHLHRKMRVLGIQRGQD